MDDRPASGGEGSSPKTENQMIIPAKLAEEYEKYVPKDEICWKQINKKRKLQPETVRDNPPTISMDYPYDIDEQQLPPPSPSTSSFCPPKRAPPPSENVEDRRLGPVRRFAVMYGKCSSRKHKKWEGDGFLEIRGRRGVLFNENLKVISSATGFKYQEVDLLSEGSRIVVGMMEVEIQSEEENFPQPEPAEPEVADLKPPEKTESPVKPINPPRMKFSPAVKLNRPFVVPLKERNFAGAAVLSSSGIRGPILCGARGPMYDPAAPDALVMPDELIRDTPLNSEDMIKVVVDPRLTTHLRIHQREGVKFLYSRLVHRSNSRPVKCGAILADDMGLGKSLQCIALIWTLLKQTPFPGTRPLVRKILIVVPSSLVQNWAQEFKKWLGRERLRVSYRKAPKTLVATKKQDIKEFQATWKTNPVLIISYDLLVRCSPEEVSEVGFDLFLCDEAHRLKNSDTKVYSFLSDLAIARRILITGTPIQNNLKEFYALMDLANPDCLGTPMDFKRTYENAITASHVPDCSDMIRARAAEAEEALQRVTKRFLIRRTADTNAQYLPPKTDYILFCRPSALQKRLYSRIPKAKGLENITDEGGFSAQHLSCIDWLRKLCNHPVILHKSIQDVEPDNEAGLAGDEVLEAFPDNFDPNAPCTGDSGKFSVLCDLLQSLRLIDPPQKIVIVSSFRRTLDLIEDMCLSEEYPTLRLDGKTPQDQRQRIVNQFNSLQDNTFVFLLSCKAGGVGLNLIGASRLVLYDLDWNPATDLQAMGRVWRDGQNHLCRIYRLVTVGTIEERILQRQVKKQGLNRTCMDTAAVANDRGTLKFSAEELKDLFRLDQSSACQTHSMMGCDCQEEDVTSENRSDNKKSSSLSQLLSWTHLSSEKWERGDGRLEDWWINCTDLSFVFYHTTEHVKIEEEMPDQVDSSEQEISPSE